MFKGKLLARVGPLNHIKFRAVNQTGFTDKAKGPQKFGVAWLPQKNCLSTGKAPCFETPNLDMPGTVPDSPRFADGFKRTFMEL